MLRSTSPRSEITWHVAAAAAILVALYGASIAGYILFHSVAEIFAIVISAAVFTLAWNTRTFSNQGYLLFTGIALFAASALNILHTLSYEGMGVFASHSANLPTQLWLARRYVEAGALVVAPFFLTRSVNGPRVLAGFAVITAVLLWAIFGGWFPEAYVPGAGLTLFKVVSEYVIAALFLAGASLLHANRRHLDPLAARNLVLAMILSAGAELLFTLYVGVYDLPNRLGHFLTVVAYYLIYTAIVRSGVIKPYRLLSEANASLSEQRQQLRQLSHQLVQVQEEERRSLARDLHDTSGQALTALKFGLAALKRTTADAGAQARIDGLIGVADSVAEELHRLSVNLRPVSLDRLGLGPALDQLVASVRHQTNTEVALTLEGLEERLPGDVETVVFRIVQEACTNIVRYAEARSAGVHVQRVDGALKVTVEDDGCGFDVDEALRRGRLGLIGVRERAQMLGGSLQIFSAPGKGSALHVVLPLVTDGSSPERGRA